MDTVRATERLLERYAEMKFVRVDAWVGTNSADQS
jgi:hypothetical protein